MSFMANPNVVDLLSGMPASVASFLADQIVFIRGQRAYPPLCVLFMRMQQKLPGPWGPMGQDPQLDPFELKYGDGHLRFMLSGIAWNDAVDTK